MRRYLPVLIYIGVAGLVMAPLLRPGFILTLDLVFTPRLPLPTELTNTYLFDALLYLLNQIIPADVIEKCVLVATLVAAGIGAHRLVGYMQHKAQTVPTALGRYFAGVLYMINPFTYSRFMAGQYLVLAGYVLLPFFVRSLLQFLATPSWQHAWPVAIWASVIGLLSIHTLGLVAMIAISALVVTLWRIRHHTEVIRNIAIRGLAITGLFLALNSFWLVPAVLGKGETASAIDQFTQGDWQAFAVSGNNLLEKTYNVARLQGFWADNRGLYELPQANMLWPVALTIVWLLVAAGLVVCLHTQRRLFAGVLGTTIIIAVVLAIGGAAWLAHYASWFNGFREPHKFVGLVALGFAVFAGIGVTELLQRIASKKPQFVPGTAVLLFSVPIILTSTMWWGGKGQLQPRQYPPDWSETNMLLDRDTDTFSVLFVPWHLYMHYDFADRIIASPAEKFFDKPIVASNELEFKKATPTKPDVVKTRITEHILPTAPKTDRLGSLLAPLHIKYILLAKDGDAWRYAYLNRQQDVVAIRETKTLILYKNTAYKEGR